ncbi:hypothetical protein RCU33_06205 [Escherichia coli]|nr:hypothetical protein [Escherichia coli]MED0126131.1 hypothetical protein [Escherichia coli]MED0159200.1 hypothetical protein [Escherichia coli]
MSNNILDDIGGYKERNKKSEMVDLLILISNDEPNGVSETKVISNGEIHFKGESSINLDASFIMTINGGVHTDTVTYISKKNKIIGDTFIIMRVKLISLRKYISQTQELYII